MRSKRVIAIGSGLVVTAGVGIAVLTGPASASNSDSFTVYARSGSQTNIDNGQPGFSAGDYDVHTDVLTRNGKTVGWNDGSCLTASVGRTADQMCRFVLHLPDGQIVADGSVRSGQSGPAPFPLAITGGTGKYDTARGQLTLTPSDGPVRIDVSVIR